MGLDISYCSKIDFESRDIDRDESDCYLYNNDMILGQSDGIKNGAYNTASDSKHGSFRAGSYSGYGGWRKALAEMIGWEIEDLWNQVVVLVQRGENLNDVLSENDEPAIDISFVELLHFSDCEGFIGPKTSAKLHADFLEWDEKARNFDSQNSYFYEKYQEWTEAFKVASDGGCVIFC